MLTNSAEGELINEYGIDSLESVTLKTTPEQDALLQQLINESLNNKSNYNLYTSNCVHKANELLTAVGEGVFSNPMTPQGLMSALQQRENEKR